MKRKLNETKPIYLQIKEQIEDAIIEGTWNEGDKIPSTNEFAAFYQINPATGAKGINELVDEEILFKRRGVGMFVAENARQLLVTKRREFFYDMYVKPLKKEADKLEISEAELMEMLKREES